MWKKIVYKQKGYPHPGEDCETKPIQKCGGDSQRVDCSWSQCFKNHYAQTYEDMGFSCRIPYVKPLLNNRQRQKRLAWAKDKKDRTAAERSKVMFSDERNFAFPLEIRVPESGGREERHRIHVA